MKPILLMLLISLCLKSADLHAEEDIFQLEAQQTVLKAKIIRNEAIKDSLMSLLTGLYMRETPSATPFGREAPANRESEAENWPHEQDADWDAEKTKTELVERVDSLKAEILSMRKRVEANKAAIQRQLKGGNP